MMEWGNNTGGRHPMASVVGFVIGLIVLGLLLRVGAWPFFVLFFCFGPWAFNTFRQSGVSETAPRKNDEIYKPKNDARAARPAEYILTEDGEVLEVIDDHAARRRADWI